MSIEKLGGNSPILRLTTPELASGIASGGINPSNVKMTGLYKEGGITQKDIDKYLEDPLSRKEIKNLISKSPIGLGDVPSKEDLEKQGCTFKGTAYHLGAPMFYDTPDGGSVTVYDGRGCKEHGEDQRKVIYKKGNLTQTMFYDKNGKLTGGNITVKDPVTGAKESYADFTTKDGNINNVMTIN